MDSLLPNLPPSASTNSSPCSNQPGEMGECGTSNPSQISGVLGTCMIKPVDPPGNNDGPVDGNTSDSTPTGRFPLSLQKLPLSCYDPYASSNSDPTVVGDSTSSEEKVPFSDDSSTGCLAGHCVEIDHKDPPNFLACWKSVKIDHTDPAQLFFLLQTTFAKGAASGVVNANAFDLSLKKCILIGMLGNIISALATSPYVSKQFLDYCCCNDTNRDRAKNLGVLIHSCIDYGYSASNITTMPLLGKTTLLEAACFVLLSGMLRQGTALWLKSDACQGTLEQRAKALASTDQLLSPTYRAFVRAIRDFCPDLVGCLVRNTMHKGHEVFAGKTSVTNAWHEVLFNTTIYTVSTFFYYLCYRAIEQAAYKGFPEKYQNLAHIDQNQAQKLKENLTQVGENFMKPLPTAENRENEEETILVEHSKTELPPDFQNQLKELATLFGFLKSPLVYLLKDPIYRSLMEGIFQSRTDPDSKKAIEIFNAVDTADLLSTVVESLADSLNDASVAKEQIQVYKLLSASLGVPINSGETSPEDRAVVPNPAFDALIAMFKSFSSSVNPSSTTSSLNSLGKGSNYGAVHTNEPNGGL